MDTGQAASSDSRMTLKDIRAGAASDLPRAEACPDAANAGVASTVHPDTPFADLSFQVRTIACLSGQYCAETFCCVCAILCLLTVECNVQALVLDSLPGAQGPLCMQGTDSGGGAPATAAAESSMRGKVARKLFSKQSQREWRTRCSLM